MPITRLQLRLEAAPEHAPEHAPESDSGSSPPSSNRDSDFSPCEDDISNASDEISSGSDTASDFEEEPNTSDDNFITDDSDDGSDDSFSTDGSDDGSDDNDEDGDALNNAAVTIQRAWAVHQDPSLMLDLPSPPAPYLMDTSDDEDQLLSEVPRSFNCPINHDVMRDPVVDHEGNSYERNAIMIWLRTNATSPITRNPLSADQLTTNRALRDAIEEYHTDAGLVLSPLPDDQQQAAAPV
jgi:hypothetical protein